MLQQAKFFKRHNRTVVNRSVFCYYKMGDPDKDRSFSKNG